MPKKFKHCAECGEKLGENYYLFADNFLQIKYFDDPTGADNAFCSQMCALQSLSFAMAENDPNACEPLIFE